MGRWRPVGGNITDEGQVEEVEEPLRDILAKDRPAVVFFMTALGLIHAGRSGDHIAYKLKKPLRYVL